MLKKHLKIPILILICLILFGGCAIIKGNHKKKCRDCPDWNLKEQDRIDSGQQQLAVLKGNGICV